MAKHPVYTYIDQRSFKAYMGNRPSEPGVSELTRIMCALIVDPDAAEDAFELFGWRETPHSISDFLGISSAGSRRAVPAAETRGGHAMTMTAVLSTINVWFERQKSPGVALKDLTDYSTKLGAWCAAAVVERAVQELDRPRSPGAALVEIGQARQLGQSLIDALRGWVVSSTDESAALFEAMAACDRNVLVPPAGFYGDDLQRFNEQSMIGTAMGAAANAALMIVGAGASTGVYEDRLFEYAAMALLFGQAGDRDVGDFIRAKTTPQRRELAAVAAEACLSYPWLAAELGQR